MITHIPGSCVDVSDADSDGVEDAWVPVKITVVALLSAETIK